MVRNEEDATEKIQKYKLSGNSVVAEALEEEFFWRLESSLLELSRGGFSVQSKQFSDLSFGIVSI